MSAPIKPGATPPKKPTPTPALAKTPAAPPLTEFAIVESIWVEGRRRVTLQKSRYNFSGTLAQAKASLAGKLFFSAKIYDKEFGWEELVATLRGTQTKQNPIS